MNKIYKSLLCILGIGALLTACETPAELIDEIDYSRVLTPLKFDAEVVASTGTDVVLTWQKIKNAEGYELEIYEQTGDSKEVSKENTGIKVGETYILGADEVPYTVYGLDVDKSYYPRHQQHCRDFQLGLSGDDFLHFGRPCFPEPVCGCPYG